MSWFSEDETPLGEQLKRWQAEKEKTVKKESEPRAAEEKPIPPEWRPTWHRKTPEEKKEAYRARAIVKDCLQGALAELGGQDFFLQMALAGGEDRRCVANIMARLIPSEVIQSVRAEVAVEITKVTIDTAGQIISAPHVINAPALPAPRTIEPDDSPSVSV